jgi:hypothetical protein
MASRGGVVSAEREARRLEVIEALRARGGARRGSMRSLAWSLAHADRYYEVVKELRREGVLEVSEEPGERWVALREEEP